MSDSIPVVITDRAHPHFDERGELTGEMIRLKGGDGRPMALVRLLNCVHGIDACYVSKGQVREDRRRR